MVVSLVYSKLTELIKFYVGEEAKGIPTFVRDPRIDGEGIYQGCIRITSRPLCPDAYRDFGGSGQFNPDEIPDVEDAYPIFPGADRDAKYLNDDETVDVCSTYAMTAMKIAKLSRIRNTFLIACCLVLSTRLTFLLLLVRISVSYALRMATQNGVAQSAAWLSILPKSLAISPSRTL